MSIAAWWASSWLMVLSMLTASVACISAFRWRLKASALMAAVPVSAALIENQWVLYPGGGTLIATCIYVCVLSLDYRLTRKDRDP